MQIKQLFEDEDAVSPVIGVILMVAITVILAAVIGTFVLGLGDQVSNTAPNPSMTFNLDEGSSGTVCGGSLDGDGTSNGASTSGEGKLTITHDGGDKIDEPRLSISDDGGNSDGWNACASNDVSEVSAGDSADPEVETSDTIRVIWEASGGGDTSTIAKWTGPDA